MFCSALGSRNFLLELRCRIFLLSCRGFLFEQRRGKYFVELAWLTTFLFNVGLLVQVLVGVVQSEFYVGLSQFFV